MPIITRATPKSPRLDLYAQSAVLPTESPDEFAAHFQELRQELKPVGLLEESQVAVIAQLLWRKHRLSLFHDAASSRIHAPSKGNFATRKQSKAHGDAVAGKTRKAGSGQRRVTR